MRRLFGILLGSGVVSVSVSAQINIVRAPTVVTFPDKQFDSVAMKRHEGHLRVMVRSPDDPTRLLDGVQTSATALAGDTARARSLPVAVRVRVRAGCHTVVESYPTYQRRQNDVTLDAPTEPRGTITTCPEA